MDGLDDWLDSQDATPLPNTADPGAVDRWLDEPSPAPKLNPQDIDNFLDSPDDTAEKVAKYEAENPFWTRLGQRLTAGGYNIASSLGGIRAAGAGSKLANLGPLFDKIDAGQPVTDEEIAAASQAAPGSGLELDIVQYRLLSPAARQNYRADLEKQFASGAEQYEKFAEKSAAIPRNPAVEAFGKQLKDKDYLGAMETFAKNPVGIVAQVGTESAPAMLPALVVGYRNPQLGAAIMGGSSAAQEYGSSVMDYLADAGVNTSDVGAIMAAMRNPELMNKASQFASTRSQMVGAMDALTGRLGSATLVPERLAKSAVKREAVNALVAQPLAQAAAGAGAEAGAQYATKGEVYDPASVALEAVGELYGAPAEAVAFGAERRRGAAAPREEPPAAPPQAAPTQLPANAVVGLQTPDGPVRVRVESVRDGNVFYTDAAGTTYGMPAEDFITSVTEAPPAADLVRGDATTVPERPAQPEPMDYGDINDFDPNAQVERAPVQPSPQQAMELPDTRAIDRAAAAAREFRKAAVEAKDAERAAYLHQQADALDNEAMNLRRQLAARSDRGGVGVPAAEVRAKATLGPLGEAAPAVSEAVTGPQPVTTQRTETPLERNAPAVSEATTGPVQPSVVQPDTRTPLEKAAPAEQPAEQPLQVRAKPTVEQLVRNRTAKLNDHQSIARQTGQSVEEVRAELQRIAGRPNGPIRQVRGKVTIDPKTGRPVQSARAGMMTYAPRRTGPVSLLEALSAAGGVNDTTGDMEAMGADTWHRGRPGTRPLVNRTGIALDDLGDWAEANGYLPTRPVDETTGENYHRDPQEVLDMIDRELRGQRQLPLGETEERGGGYEPTPLERKEHRLRTDLARLQESPAPDATLDEMEAQLEERLAMMNAATVDDAVDMMNAELDALDRIMEDTYAGWEPDAAARAEAAPEVSEDIGGPETVGPAEAARAQSDVDRGPAGGGAAPEAERGGVGGRQISMGDNRPATGGEQVQRPGQIPGRNEGAAAGQPAGERSGREVSRAGGRGAEAVSDAGTGTVRGPESEILTSPNQEAAKALGFTNLTAEFQASMRTGERASDAAVRWVREQGIATGHEHVVTLDADRNVISAGTSHHPSAVKLGPEVIDRLSNINERAAVIHSHPTNTPTSPADISILSVPTVQTITAIGSDGMRSTIALMPQSRSGILAGIPYDQLQGALQRIAIAAQIAAQESILKSAPGTNITEGYGLSFVGVAFNEGLARAGILYFNTNAAISPMFRAAYDAAAAAAERAARDAADTERSSVRRSAGPEERPGSGEGVLERNRPERQDVGVAPVAAGERADALRSLEGPEGADLSGSAKEAVRENTGLVRQILDRFRRNPGTAKSNAQKAKRTRTVKGPPELRKLSRLSSLISFAATIASKDTTSARYYTAEKAMARYSEMLVRDGADRVASYYGDQVGAEGRAKINKILEHDRLQGVNRKDTGQRVVVRMPDRYTGELAKPGEVVTLNAVESRALSDVRKFFDDRWRKFGEAMAHQFGWTGPFNEAALNEAIAESESVRERNQAERALEIFRLVQDMRRAGYVPFARYGDTKIAIRPKPKAVPGKDDMQFGRAIHVELVPTRSVTDLILDKTGGEAPSVSQRRAELEKQYPRDEYDYEVTPLNTLNDVRKVDLPAVEKMFMLVNMKNPEMGPKFYEEIVNQIFEERKAGFRKQSNNIPGYSTDFERAIADYIHQTSSVISRMELGKSVNRAYEATQSHQDRDVADFWKDYREYVEKPGDEFGTLRKVAFWSFIWGSPGSALVNLTQTPLVTLPQIASWAGPKALPSLANAITEAVMAIRVGKEGLTIDWSKLGNTPAEKSMIRQLRAEGVLDPIIARDLQGYDRGTSPTNRKWRRGFDRAYEIGASAFNAMEMANRIGAALGAFRLAQSPGTMQKAQKVYQQDAEFRQMVGRAGTPLDMARFMVDETQFMGGKRGRPQVMRGAGSLLLQWKQYQANWLRLMFKNMNRMGPEGKIAGTAMLVGLVATAGLLGLPFAEDALDAASWGIKTATGIDPLLERRLARWLRDTGLGEIGAEIAMRGPSREYLGIDLGSRLGMGQMVPEGSVENAFPLLGATVGKASEFWNRLQSGQVEGAMTALMPKGVADVMRGAVVLPDEGYRSQRGDITLFPDEITAGDRIARGVGFQPARFARLSEYRYAQRELAAATQEASTKLITNVAAELALATKARQSGDPAAEKRHTQRYIRLLRENAEQLRNKDLPGWLKIPQPAVKAIRMRLQQMLDFDRSILKRTGKTKREEMMDYPLPME